MNPFWPDPCLGCTACEIVCPVVASDARFAGPKVLGPALHRRQTGGWPGEAALTADEVLLLGADLCLQCHRCDLACPAGLPVSSLTRASLILAATSGIRGGRPRSARRRLLADQERLGRLLFSVRYARLGLRALSHRASLGLDRSGLRLLGLSPSRSLWDPARHRLSAWLRQRQEPCREGGPKTSVLLFAGCHARFHDQKPARAAAAVLWAAGYRVIFPPQVCCGSPAFGTGAEATAAQAVEANVRLLTRAFEQLGGPVPVVTPCPSCALALRDTFPRIRESEVTRRLSDQIWDLGEFLAGPARPGLDRLAARASGAKTNRKGKTVWTYHTPCHLRALGVGRPFVDLLLNLGAGESVDAGAAGDGCCGMGGLSGVTAAGYGRSLAAGARVLEAYTGLSTLDHAPVLLSDCPLCRWQISDLSRLSSAHPVEVLAGLL